MLFASDFNYNPGRVIPKGQVFTEAQWVSLGGSASDLAEHVAKGYIKEVKQALPPVVVTVAPVQEEVKQAPQGIWNFKKEDLENLSLEVLNTIYKQKATDNGLSVRAYKDKDSLIEKMTSEG